MPAKKPKSLIKKHETKEETTAREESESAMMPTTPLTVFPPAALKGKANVIAAAEWTKLITLYNELDGTIVTKLDERMLITYCKLIQEELKLEEKVDELDKAAKDMQAKALKIKPDTENFKTWVAMWAQVNGLTGNFKGMDARLDGKRKHRLSLEQSLYLTPRSRAGVAPETKPPEAPEDPMEKHLKGKKGNKK